MNRRSDRAIERAAAIWAARRALGSMSEADAEEFEAWRVRDARHGQCYDRLTGALASVAGQEDLMRRAHAAGSLRERAVRRKALAGMACIAVAVSGGVALFGQWPADLATGRGAIAHYRLADGSDLWLDANSAVDIDMSVSRRLVRLRRGRMHVTVAHHNRPFAVSVAGREVVDVGTAFDVAVEPDGGSTFVTQGRVELRSAAGWTLATAGHGLRWRGDMDATPVGDRDGADAVRWRAGEIVFHRRPLAEVIAILDRYSEKRLVLMNAAAGRHLVSGVVRIREVSAALSSLANSQGLSASDWGFVIVLR